MTKKTTAPEIAQEAAPGLLVKLVSIEYGRKLNLETISKHRPFESAERKATMWADIDPDEQGDPAVLQKRIQELHEIVKQTVIASIQETVASVRAADQSLKYSSIAIDAAFKSILDGNDFNLEIGPDTRDRIQEVFWSMLKETQANLQSQ